MDLSPISISLKTTVCAGIFTFFAGIIAAWAVGGVQNRRLRAFLDGVLTMPLVLPPTVAGFFLLYIFGVNRPLGRLFQDVFGVKIAFSWAATVIAAAVVSFPMMYRSTRAGLAQIDRSMIEEAKMLGLGRFSILWKIQVPCALPSILSGMILALTRGLGEYGATAMLAGNIKGKTRTLPLAVYSEVAGGHMERAWIYVAVILAIALWAVFLMNTIADRGDEDGRG